MGDQEHEREGAVSPAGRHRQRARRARGSRAGGCAAAESERLYRAQADAVTGFFARRSAGPQAAAALWRRHWWCAG
jgi:hypothetical protein